MQKSTMTQNQVTLKNLGLRVVTVMATVMILKVAAAMTVKTRMVVMLGFTQCVCVCVTVYSSNLGPMCRTRLFLILNNQQNVSESVTRCAAASPPCPHWRQACPVQQKGAARSAAGREHERLEPTLVPPCSRPLHCACDPLPWILPLPQEDLRKRCFFPASNVRGSYYIATP